MTMQPERPSASELDEDTLAFVRRVFGFARAGEAGELATLLGQGLPPNLRNEKGDSLLMLACYHGQAEAARGLLEGGAGPAPAERRGQTPLAGAAFKGALDVARLLLARGAAVDGRADGGRTPLMLAAMFNRVE